VSEANGFDAVVRHMHLDPTSFLDHSPNHCQDKNRIQNVFSIPSNARTSVADKPQIGVSGRVANSIGNATCHAKALSNCKRAFVRLKPLCAPHADAM
jgi:hypothetical protein